MQSPRIQSDRPPKRHKGLVMIFTGDGKGKTTAAMGLALRATGNRMRVRIIQFIKGTWKTGERPAFAQLAELGWPVELEIAGRGFTIDRLRDPRVSDEEHQVAARAGLERAKASLDAGEIDLLVLDEIMGSIKAGLVTVDEVLDLVERKHPATHLVLTGRNAPLQLVEAADLVTEMTMVKHHYRGQGITAQRGVEF
jgi:cob(I)alamin adenosyltransferase